MTLNQEIAWTEHELRYESHIATTFLFMVMLPTFQNYLFKRKRQLLNTWVIGMHSELLINHSKKKKKKERKRETLVTAAQYSSAKVPKLIRYFKITRRRNRINKHIRPGVIKLFSKRMF